MTTTLTNDQITAGAAVLDLDKLEALACAATRGPWRRSERPSGPFWHISSEYTIGGERCKQGRQAIGSVHAASKRDAPKYAAMFQANADFVAAANPAAVLALIELARRAKPEGEAPQDDAMVVPRELLARCLTSMRHAVTFSDTGKGRPPSQTCMFEIEELAALLSTPAAQQAAAPQAGQVAKGPDQQQIEWGNDLQGRLIDLSQDMTESDDARQVMAEAACLLASLTGHAVSQ